LLPDFSGRIEQLFTVRQVAELVRVCSATVYKWAADGVLPHVRIVNVIRIRGEDVNRLLSAPALMPPAPPKQSL
jgi:excisionase family DNA binding protein